MSAYDFHLATGGSEPDDDNDAAETEQPDPLTTEEWKERVAANAAQDEPLF
jgi:hypothetical protein